MPLQTRRKIYSPSGLKNPDRVAWLEIVVFDEALPLFGEIVCPEHPRGSKVAGYDLAAGAGKLLEIGRSNFRGNGTLFAQVVAESEIALVIGEDEIGGPGIVAHKADGIGHVAPALVGAH